MDSVRSGAFGHLFRPDNFIFGKFPFRQTLHRKPRSTGTEGHGPPSTHSQAEPTPTLQLALEAQREGSVQGTEATVHSTRARATELRGQDLEDWWPQRRELTSTVSLGPRGGVILCP